MKCFRCQTENNESVIFCEKCGSLLSQKEKSDRFRKKNFFMALAVIIVCAAGIAYLFRAVIPPSVQMTESVSVDDKKKVESGRQEKHKGYGVKPGAAAQEPSMDKGVRSKIADESSEDPLDVMRVVAGWVNIIDPWGRQVNKFRAGLAGTGWLALPSRACLGGNRWLFSADSGLETEISGGLWINGDKVGLWHLTEETDGSELAAWNKGKLVSWKSLESSGEYQSVTLIAGGTEGFFMSVYLPDYINEIGIFFQDNKVVGWSFGKWLPKGYMWTAATEAPKYKTWVRYFYDVTYANGREEQFALALALAPDMQKDYLDLDQLASFVKGFQLNPKLAPEDTPYYLLPEAIIKQMRVLAADAVSRGEGNWVVNILNSQVLRRIGDIGLLIDIVPVIAAVRSYDAAINEIEVTGRDLVRQAGLLDVPKLDKLHLLFYQEWLQSLVADGDVSTGLQTFNAAKTYYPDDPYIHLLGVELALLNSDWQEAERLLYMREYPLSLQERYLFLARRIAEMKGEEEWIVIRFPRGSNRIPVTAVINEEINQDFIIDTGASMMTIPSSTAEELGLEIVKGRRIVTTASGVVTATEVIIDAVEIGGWVEYDVRALVLDIPNQPGLGLLGLNYLGRFRMGLKPEEGTVMLTPR